MLIFLLRNDTSALSMYDAAMEPVGSFVTDPSMENVKWLDMKKFCGI